MGLATSRIARLGRIALLASPILIGVALFFTVFATYRGVVTASELLVRGQADFIHDSVRGELARQRTLPAQWDLAAVLEALAGDGLTYVATVDDKGHVIGEAGTPSTDRAELERAIADMRGGDLVPVGDGKLRSVSRRGRGGGRRNPSFMSSGAPRGALVIEMEPRLANQLEANARQTLAVGALTAGGLVILALVLVRWLLRREADARRQEQERRLASLGQMSAVLAHEIRNPLASLKGNAQLLARALPEGEKPRAKADRVVGEAVRLETLVNDLLALAKTGELRRADVDPAALAREIGGELGARVEVAVAPGAPARARLDADRMREALRNLVENALQISDATVTLGVGPGPGRGLRYTVRDRGPGIPAEDLDHVFEPFFTRRVQGTGLGLAVARRAVELHGGAILAANADDGGAVFTLDIPR